LGVAVDAMVDLELFGLAPEMAVYDGLAPRRAALGCGAALLLDTKSVAQLDPFLDMQAMLMEMTKELRERFQRFQSQKASAERDALEASDAAGDEAGDGAARKVALGDAKAAIEAVSLIVRTLEKIDSLQRTLIVEQAEAEAARGEPDDAAALEAEFDRLVEQRVTERLDAAREEWCRANGLGGTNEPAGAGGPGGAGGAAGSDGPDAGGGGKPEGGA
jgi:hypothetical protein